MQLKSLLAAALASVAVTAHTARAQEAADAQQDVTVAPEVQADTVDTAPTEPAAQDTPASPEATAEAAAPATIAVQELHPKPAEESAPQEDEGNALKLDTVEVTASYRKENIQDVTGSAQAFSGRALDKAGVTGMEDYLRQVPSVSLQKSGNGKANIAMRGISNVNANDTGYGDGSPTVGVYLNDVGIQGSGVFPDLNIFDLQRIEVLKGPQGTLYGEGSMGGAIKLVTNAPDTHQWQARGEVMYSTTADGAPSHDMRAAVNVPMIDDTLAARVVGNVRKTGGFVDYTNLGRPDANSIDASSLRGVLSYHPTDKLELEYMYLGDDERRNQFPVVDAGHEQDLTNSREENQYAVTNFSINALTARWSLPFANLTSVTAFYSTFRDSVRRAPVLQTLLETQLRNTPVTPPDIFKVAPLHVATDLGSFSQEVRLVSFGGETFDWIAGAFYRNRNQGYGEEKREDSVPEDPTGLFTGILSGFNPLQGRQEQGYGKENFRQAAGYGEVTWNAIPGTFEITGGLRAFQEDVSFFINTQFYGVEAFLLSTDPSNIDAADGTAHVYFQQSIKTSGILPKLSAAWHFNQDHMAYAMIARGFRSGTPNIYSALQSGPPLVQPDYVWNQEIGTKSTWLDGALITNLAAYRINWQDLQGTVLGKAKLGIVPVDFAHLDNAGDAVVMGAEASVMWTPAEGLVLLGGLGYNEGHITKPSPSSGVIPNARLPNTPRLTWSGTANYSWPLFFAFTGEASATYTFVGDQLSIYEVKDGNGKTNSFPLDAYGLVKASLGVRRNGFHAQVFGDNLTDKRAIIAISAPIPQYTIITPRVLGVRLGYDF